MEYSALEKSFVSLAVLPCAALIVGIYAFAKRSLLKNNVDSVSRRMELWYVVEKTSFSPKGSFRITSNLCSTGTLQCLVACWVYSCFVRFRKPLGWWQRPRIAR